MHLKAVVGISGQ